MAAEFLRSHGIDLDEELTLAYRSTLETHSDDVEEREVEFRPARPIPVGLISDITTGNDQTARSLRIDGNGRISAWALETTHSSGDDKTGHTRLVLPSLVHPHVHLDKPYLLSHTDTSHLQPETGIFEEALSLTAKAKTFYTTNALLERGAQLLAESTRAGVTHLRGFCEVDTSVALKCIQAGIKLKDAWAECLYVQIAAFAQDPLFSTKIDGTRKAKGDQAEADILDGNENLKLLKQALEIDGVEVLATTPYVEASLAASKRNIDWAVTTSIEHQLHLDFHLDYNLNADKEPLIWYVLDRLRKSHWSARQKQNRTVCLGHCTRLTLFSAEEWQRLAHEAADLPVYFIGLPTSDLFMQGRPESATSASQRIAFSHNRPRSTLHVPAMLELGLKAAMGINNIGNAFTPFGSADPLDLAKWCVGIYQDGTAKAAQTLYECVSWRAKEAIGLASSESACASLHDLPSNEEANLIIFGSGDSGKKFSRQSRSIQEVIWNPPSEHERMVVYKGKHIKV